MVFYRYSIFPPDNCVQYGNSIGLLQNIVKKNNECFFVVKKYSILKNGFEFPCQSSKIYVYEVSELDNCIDVINKCDIVRKYMAIKMSHKTMVVPL